MRPRRLVVRLGSTSPARVVPRAVVVESGVCSCCSAVVGSSVAETALLTAVVVVGVFAVHEKPDGGAAENDEVEVEGVLVWGGEEPTIGAACVELVGAGVIMMGAVPGTQAHPGQVPLE